MNIRYKGIYSERTEDAPFIGALICANDCNINCEGCFNQYLKNEPTLIKDSKDIIEEVRGNPFNKGIILAGLEWTLQPKEMKELIKLALLNDLQVMLYTGLEETVFKEKFIDILDFNIYIKFGSYEQDLICNDNIQNGVKLATSNQSLRKVN